MTDQLPAIIPSGTLATPTDIHLVLALIADVGEPAAWRYVEFFTANIRNPNTRRAYARACTSFFAWCEERGLTLTTIRPHDVATYIETRHQTHSAPDVKQQLAAVRMMFDWLITGQIVPVNPAAAVRGPKHVVKTGKTAVLDPKEWRKMIDAIRDCPECGGIKRPLPILGSHWISARSDGRVLARARRCRPHIEPAAAGRRHFETSAFVAPCSCVD
jgi:hypothetical protein